MNDTFGQPLAVGDDVAVSVRGYLRRGRIAKINKAQARVVYQRGYGNCWNKESSVYPQYIVKMVAGDHKPVEEVVPEADASDIPILQFVFNPTGDTTD